MACLLRRRSGQAAVEFALVLPVIVILAVMVAELGLLLQAHVQVANAAREAARAGSLYLSGMYQYTSCESECPSGYGNGGECWTVEDWVDNALRERIRDSSGCPTSSSSSTVHALGRLNPAQCPSASTGSSCWFLTSLKVGGTAVPAGTTEDWFYPPVATASRVGEPVEVTVSYRYEMPFLGGFLSRSFQPLVITKTVIMRLQNK
jgi:type II secretory pathway pseudopilin PulG